MQKAITVAVLTVFLSSLGTTTSTSAEADLSESGHRPNLEGASLKGLLEVTLLIAREVSQAAFNTINLLSQAFEDTSAAGEEPCFVRERQGQELDGHLPPGTNFLLRLEEDYHSAVGYSGYIEGVSEYYTAPLQSHPTEPYSLYLADLQRTVNNLRDSLANLVIFVNSSALSDGAADTANGTLPSHCTNYCYIQQVRIFQRLEGFASIYVPNDIAGLKDQHKS